MPQNVDIDVQVQDVNSGNIETIYCTVYSVHYTIHYILYTIYTILCTIHFVQVWAGCVQIRPDKPDVEAAGEFFYSQTKYLASILLFLRPVLVSPQCTGTSTQQLP